MKTINTRLGIVMLMFLLFVGFYNNRILVFFFCVYVQEAKNVHFFSRCSYFRLQI